MIYWRKPLDQDRIKVPLGTIEIIEERCKGCGFCVEFCPRHVLVMSEKTNAKGYHPPKVTEDTYCINCGLCMLLCPDFAIFTKGELVEISERKPRKEKTGGGNE